MCKPPAFGTEASPLEFPWNLYAQSSRNALPALRLEEQKQQQLQERQQQQHQRQQHHANSAGSSTPWLTAADEAALTQVVEMMSRRPNHCPSLTTASHGGSVDAADDTVALLRAQAPYLLSTAAAARAAASAPAHKGRPFQLTPVATAATAKGLFGFESHTGLDGSFPPVNTSGSNSHVERGFVCGASSGDFFPGVLSQMTSSLLHGASASATAASQPAAAVAKAAAAAAAALAAASLPVAPSDGSLLAVSRSCTSKGPGCSTDIVRRILAETSAAAAAAAETSGERAPCGDVVTLVRKARRMLSNRESAKRSRSRRRERLEQLEIDVVALREENEKTHSVLDEALSACQQLQQQNEVLSQEVLLLRSRLEADDCKNPASAAVAAGDRAEVESAAFAVRKRKLQASSMGESRAECAVADSPSTAAPFSVPPFRKLKSEAWDCDSVSEPKPLTQSSSEEADASLAVDGAALAAAAGGSSSPCVSMSKSASVSVSAAEASSTGGLTVSELEQLLQLDFVDADVFQMLQCLE